MGTLILYGFDRALQQEWIRKAQRRDRRALSTRTRKARQRQRQASMGPRPDYAETPGERPNLYWPTDQKTVTLWKLMMRRPHCWYCGRALAPGGDRWERPTLDHVRPRYLGGTLHRTNVVLACLGCNMDRDQTPLVHVAVTIAEPRRVIVACNYDEPEQPAPSADDLRAMALLLLQDDDTTPAAVLLTAVADAVCG